MRIFLCRSANGVRRYRANVDSVIREGGGGGGSWNGMIARRHVRRDERQTTMMAFRIIVREISMHSEFY